MSAGSIDREDIKRVLASMMAACAMLAVTATAWGEHGRTVGNAAVTSTGAATYTIPLDLPRGTNGLTPGLAITYEHRMGAGPLGVGWALSGLSAIARCESTQVQDGAPRNVRLDLHDQFCLDDQRLRLVAGGHGMAGSEYRTEVEAFARITAHGAAGSGPAFFRVEQRDGMIHEYGNSADSRIESLGQATARAWALTSIRDRSGNEIRFSYAKDTTNGSYHIDSISYASNPDQGVAQGAHRVEFKYEQVPVGEVSSRYLSGRLIKRVKRLIGIEIKHRNDVVRQYELAYESNPSSSARSRLHSIRECAGTLQTCYSPTVFTYQEGVPTYQTPGTVGQISTHRILVIDINGDGRSDLVYPSSGTSGSGTWMYRLAVGEEFPGVDINRGAFASPVNSGITNTNFDQAIPIDYNADGREDFLVPYQGGTWWVVLGSDSGLMAPVNTGVAVTSTAGNAVALDVTGDGLDDLIWGEFDGQGGDAIYYRAREPNGTFSATPVILIHAGGPDNYIVSPAFGQQLFHSRLRQPDFNGDGYADLIVKLMAVNHEVGLSEDWSEIVLGGGAGRIRVDDVPLRGFHHIDLNGDGYTDLVHATRAMDSTINWVYRFSQGTSFSSPVTVSSGSTVLPRDVMVVDMEGDGYEDMVVSYTTDSYLGHVRSTGEQLLPPVVISTALLSGDQHFVADVDGDGQEDILRLRGSELSFILHAGRAPDLLLSATDGFGNATSFEYKPLNSISGCYSRDAAAPTFPAQAYMQPMQVVCKMISSDGIGGTYSHAYHYSNGALHLQGRGFLGFGKRRVVDSRNDMTLIEEYSTDPAAYDRLGALVKSTARQSVTGPVIGETALSWSSFVYGAGAAQRRFSYVSQSVKKEYEVGGIFDQALVRTTTTVNQAHQATGVIHDATTTVVEAASANGAQAGASYSTRVHWPVASLLVDTTHWCLGYPQEVETTAWHSQFGGDPITRRTAVYWDTLHCRPTEVVTEPGQGSLQLTQSLSYDAFGNVSADTITGGGMTSRTTLYNWGTAGHYLRSITNALSHVTQLDWDEASGLISSETDPNGLSVVWQYDAMGRRTGESRPDGTTTQWAYTACNGCMGANVRTQVVERHVDALGTLISSRQIFADAWDRPVAVTAPSLSGATTKTARQFDTLGRVWAESAPCWASACAEYWTTVQHDLLNRPVLIQRPLSDSVPTPQTTHIHYEGLTTRTIDALGKQQTQIANALGALVHSADHSGYHQQFDHDAFGNTLRVVDSLGAALISNAFNIRGMRVQHHDLAAGTWLYTHNALGEITSQTDAKGQTATFEHDLLGRLTRRVEPEGRSEWFWGTSATARNIGKLAGVSGPGYSESYQYDARGRMQTTSISSDATYGIDYSYDLAGRLSTLTYPASTAGYRLKLQYHYQNGHLSAVSDANSSSPAFWTAESTDARGNIIAERLGNGIQTLRGYDSVTGLIDYLDSGAGSVQDLSYSWDAVGNLIERRDQRQGLIEGFQYDDLHRLISTTGPDPITLSYDARGNMVAKSGNTNNVRSGPGHSVTYTSYNLPSVIASPSGDSSQFFYAPDRSRWKQTATYGGTPETTIYIGNLVEKVMVGSTVLWRHYIAGAAGPVAVYTRKSSGDTEIHYLTRDHLGSVDSFTDAAGSVEFRTSFGAFGQRRKEEGWSGSLTNADWQGVAGTTRRGFTFHETLDNLSLTHMNGRVYDQLSNRFLSPDPIVQAPGFTQSFNRYAYVFNNPLGYTDPSGYVVDGGLSVVIGSFIANSIKTYILGGIFGSYGMSRAEKILRAERRKLQRPFNPYYGVMRPATVEVTAMDAQHKDTAANPGGVRGTILSTGNPYVFDMDAWVSARIKVFPVEGADSVFYRLPHVPERSDSKADPAAAAGVVGGAISVAGGMEYTHRMDGQWKGKNGKWYRESWGGNGATGARSAAFELAAGWKHVGAVGTVVGGVAAAGAGAQVLLEGRPEGAIKPGIDLTITVSTAIIGPHGWVIGTGYFLIDSTVGWEEALELMDENMQRNREILGPSWVPWARE